MSLLILLYIKVYCLLREFCAIIMSQFLFYDYNLFPCLEHSSSLKQSFPIMCLLFIFFTIFYSQYVPLFLEIISSYSILIFVMARINDNSVSLSSSFENNDYSHLIRIKTYGTLDSKHSDGSHFVSMIIIVTNSPKYERFSSGYLDRETSLVEYSFFTILSNDDVRGYWVINFVSAPSPTIEHLTFPYLTTPEVEDGGALNKEKARNFIKTYYTIYGQDPSDVEIKDHLTRETYLTGVNWLRPPGIFLANKLLLSYIELVKSVDACKYKWVDYLYYELPQH